MIEKPCQTTQEQGESRGIDPDALRLQMSMSQNVRLQRTLALSLEPSTLLFF